MSWVLGLLVVLLVVALVGHGLWLLGRSLLRGVRSIVGRDNPRPVEAAMCPRCGEAWAVASGVRRCPACGWPGPTPRHGRLQSQVTIGLLLQRLRRYRRAGLLPDEVGDRVLRGLAEERDRLLVWPVDEAAMRTPAAAGPPALAGTTPEEAGPPPAREEPRESPPPRPGAVDRARVYRDAREAERSHLPAAQAPEPRRRPSLGGPLAAFMEERNIRWGELVGGLLIVGCSLALVVGYWERIAERPVLRFALANGAVAAFFAVGLHADRRWRLPTTARGLLMIASLLVPLSVLAIVSARGPVGVGPVLLGGELVALGGFAALIGLAGRSTGTAGPWATAIGVAVPSAAILAAGRWVAPGVGGVALAAIGAVPLLAHAGATLRGVLGARRRAELDEAAADDLLRTLGLTAFAAAVALGALIDRAGATVAALRQLAGLAPLAGAPALAAGLTLWRGAAPSLTWHRVAGGSIAAAGVLVMLAGVALAWPEPASLAAVAAFDGAVLLAVAIAFAWPAALAMAGGCLATAGLIAALVVTGPLPWTGVDAAAMVDALTSPRSGAALASIAVLFEVAAAAALLAGRRPEARALGLVTAMAGLAGLALVSWRGLGVPGDPAGATWVYAALAAAALAGAALTARWPLFDADGPPAEARALAWSGSSLMLAALVQGFVFRVGDAWGLALPWSAALLGHATLAAALAVTTFGRRGMGEGEAGAIRLPLIRSALATSAMAAARLAWTVPTAEPSATAVHLLWLAGTWAALAWLIAGRGLFWASQAALGGAVALGVAAWLEGQPWFGDAPARWRWLDPRALQAEGIALTLLGLAWIGLRLGVRSLADARPKDPRLGTARRLMEPPWPTFDRLTAWAAVAVLVALSVYGVVPGAAQELSPRSFAARLAAPDEGALALRRVVPPASAFEVAGIPHRPALGPGSWLLLGSVLLVLLAGQWERFRRADLLGALVVAAMAAPLAAGRWEPDVAVGSALRWGGAVGLLALSVPIWAGGWLAGVAGRVGWRVGPDRPGGLGAAATALVLALASLPPLAMAVYATAAALQVHPVGPGLSDLWYGAAVLFVALAGVGLGALLWAAQGSAGRPGSVRAAGGLLIALGSLGLLAATAAVVAAAMAGDPIVGPERGTFFDRIGPAGSYVPPIVLAALVLVGHAIRGRSPGFALAGGLLLQAGATVGWMLAGPAAAGPLDPLLWLRMAQLNAAVGSTYALGWIVAVDARRRRRGEPGPAAMGPAPAVQTALPVALVGLVLVVGVLGLLAEPGVVTVRPAIADPWGWAAFLLTAGAVAGWSGRRLRPGLVAAAVPATAAMLALSAARRDAGDWLTYHAMIVAMAAAAGALLLVGWNRRGLRPAGGTVPGGAAITGWAAVATAALVAFALRAHGEDPVDPTWWSVGGLAASATLAAAVAGWSAGRWGLYVAGVLLNLAATLWWLDVPPGWLRASLENVVVVNVVALALPVPAWLRIELRAIRPARPLDSRPGLAPFHRVAAWGGVGLLALMVLAWVLGDAGGGWRGPAIGLGFAAAIGTTGVALAAGFWDDRSRSEVAGLYLLGLCAAGWVLAGLDPPPAMLGWVGAVLLASYAVAAGALWSARGGIRRLGDRLGVPRAAGADDPDAGLGWLIPANVGLSAVVLALAFGVVLTDPDLLPRFSAAKAGLATALAIGLLARGERRSALRATALGFGAAGAVAWGWAWVAPGSPTATLDRAVAVMVAFVTTAVGYGIGLVKVAPRATRWGLAARRTVPALLGLAAVAMLGVIAGELLATAAGEAVAISGPALVLVAAALPGGAAAALVAAIVPGRDPLRLPERRRTAYVYGAEALLALLALHLGLTMPWLFAGVFARYWPLIVLGLSFAGVGLGELFRRQGRMVLAEPLERSGAVLPVLPLLGAFWLEPRPGEDTLFLVLAGGLYATLALLRSSTGFGALAALAFNAGLWTVLGRREGLGLLEHPQFWVVPPALCVLAGAYLNRDRLRPSQSAALRHAAASVVYLSSTADLVVNGVAEDPWLPLVLGGLSLLGIFAGIALRVRGFLLLGSAFLGLSVFAIVWYAAVDLRQTWLWAASGIVVGVLILAAFAVFEKRRREVMKVLEHIRHWEA